MDSVLDEIQIIINGKQLNRVTHNKYCGLMYDYNMKWNIHVANIVKNKLLGICILQTKTSINYRSINSNIL